MKQRMPKESVLCMGVKFCSLHWSQGRGLPSAFKRQKIKDFWSSEFSQFEDFNYCSENSFITCTHMYISKCKVKVILPSSQRKHNGSEMSQAAKSCSDCQIPHEYRHDDLYVVLEGKMHATQQTCFHAQLHCGTRYQGLYKGERMSSASMALLYCWTNDVCIPMLQGQKKHTNPKPNTCPK